MKTASVIGATGLIGSHLINLLGKDNYFDEIKVISRRDLYIKNSKFILKVIDFTDLPSFQKAIEGSDVIFCAVGTTRSKVKGNLEQYRKIDYDIPVNAARFAELNGSSHFLFISSVGADPGKKNFYLKLKGEVEEKIKNFNIPSISIFRPSLLLGKRDEFRLGEKISQLLLPPLSFLIPSEYKPINAADVASALLNESKKDKIGIQILHYNEMMKKTKR
jgi:uncharacterized protein YbjT (DUF2867 family)